MSVPFERDFEGSFEIAILTALLKQAEQPLIMAREAEPDQQMEWRMAAMNKLMEVDQRLQLLMQKVKAGL